MTAISRRQLMAAGAVSAVALATGVGTAVGLVRPSHARKRATRAVGPSRAARPEPPPALLAAAEREVALLGIIAGLAAIEPSQQATLAPLASDHEAHAAALRSLLAGYAANTGSSASGSTVSSGPSATGTSATGTSATGTPSPVTLADLLATSQAAATAGQAAATLAAAEFAPLLASIAACEAGHVQLLSPS